jgi:hypothetical protein
MTAAARANQLTDDAAASARTNPAGAMRPVYPDYNASSPIEAVVGQLCRVIA